MALSRPCLAFLLSLAAPASAAPIYLGSAARPGVADEDRAAIDAALVRALKRQGIPVVDASAAAEDAAAKASAAAREALDDATAAYADEDWRMVLDKTQAAFAAWEKGPAFSEDKKDSEMVRDILALRALAALTLKKRDVASSSMRALLTLQPKYEPNRKKAPRPLLKLVDQTREAQKASPLATLQLKSKPTGARVTVDGRRRGKTPLLLDDVPQGIHYVLIEANDGRHVERVEVGNDGAAINARLANRRRATAKEVLALVERPVGAKRLVEAASEAGNDVVVAVLLPAGKDVEVIAGRISDGEVKCVLGVTVGKLENDRERSAFVLAEAIREQETDHWLDPTSKKDAAALRTTLFSGMGTTTVEEEGESVSPALIAVGVVAGAVGIALLGGSVAVFAVREARKGQGFTWGVDASGLEND